MVIFPTHSFAVRQSCNTFFEIKSGNLNKFPFDLNIFFSISSLDTICDEVLVVINDYSTIIIQHKITVCHRPIEITFRCGSAHTCDVAIFDSYRSRIAVPTAKKIIFIAFHLKLWLR